PFIIPTNHAWFRTELTGFVALPFQKMNHIQHLWMQHMLFIVSPWNHIGEIRIGTQPTILFLDTRKSYIVAILFQLLEKHIQDDIPSLSTAKIATITVFAIFQIEKFTKPVHQVGF